MIFSGISPRWFLGFDAFLEVLFIFITLIIAWYSFKAHRLSGKRRFLWWGVGFLSISAGYAVTAFANYYLFARIIQTVTSPIPGAIDFNWLHFLGHLAHNGFFIGGYLLLAVVMLRFDDTRLITLFASIVGLLALAITLSDQKWLLHLSLVIFLGHIVFYVWLNPKAKHEKPVKQMHPRLRKSVIVGFSLLFLGQLAYLFLPIAGIAYVVGHVLELLGFGLLATSMFIVLKK
ncbi:hypothetical protein GOV07_04705 [Candidatus Woesearchaeota archaeon]|nr:hypothetical protein [Candidatus Woesearchaeota archaeon]